MDKEQVKAAFADVVKPMEGKIAELEAKLAANSDNEALKVELAATKKAAEDLKAEFEAKLAKVETAIFDGSANKTEKSAEFKNEFVRLILQTRSGSISQFGEAYSKLKAKFALADGQNITNDADGGYLVPEVLSQEILNKTVNELSPVLGLVRRIPMGKNLAINVRVGIPSARRDGEGDTALKGKSTYLPVTLSAQRLSVSVPATWEYLNFTVPGDATSRIVSDASEAFAAKMQYELFNGVKSSNQLEGILTNTSIEKVESVTTGAFDYEDLVNLESAVQTTNDTSLAYFMHRKVLGAIRKLQDGAGNYIFTPGTASKPSTINGIPVYIVGNTTIWNGSAAVSVPVMPDAVTAGATPILLADMSGYVLGDSQGMTLMFDDKTGASEAVFNWNFHAWNNGVVALPEKFKLLKIKGGASS